MDGVAIDLWLDWQTQSRPAIVVPYAKARVATVVEYRIVMSKQGSGGNARIAQGGTVVLPQDVATPLSRIAVNHSPGDACAVEVSVRPRGESATVKNFECPP